MDETEVHARRLNAKEVITAHSNEICIFPVAEGTAKLSGRDHGVREPTLMRAQPVVSEDLREELQGSSERSQPTDDTKDEAKARNDFWSNRRRFYLSSSRETSSSSPRAQEEAFQIPLKYIFM